MIIPNYILKNLIHFIATEQGAHRRVALYSRGNLTRALLQQGFLKDLEIVGIADKGAGTPPHALEGIPVHAPVDIREIAPEVILICSSKYHLEIRAELSALFPDGQIDIVDICQEDHRLPSGEAQSAFAPNAALHISHLLALQCRAEIRAVLQEAKYDDPKRLEKYAFRCYSQHDEDGMITEIFRRLGDKAIRTFVEFGVGDGLENNSLFLLKMGWRGLWIEGSPENSALIRQRFQPVIESSQLAFEQRFITAENINEIIAPHFQGEIGMLCVDIDGNDYYVWDAIEVVNPQLVVIEYNAKFPPPIDWSIAYDPAHNWDFSDYQGASLSALSRLARTKGYQLVGCNLNGTNAFFVRSDLAEGKFCDSLDETNYYHPPRYYLTEGYKLMSGHVPSPRMGTQFDNTKK
jgi:hypothetical protein